MEVFDEKGDSWVQAVMMEKKVDRRVRKTKMQLRSGLAALLQEKSVSRITVKELVDEVEMNRSTFYLHYKDIPSLMGEIEEEMAAEIERAIREHPIDSEKKAAFYFIADIYHVLARNREIGSALIGPNGDVRFIQKIQHIIEENSREFLEGIFSGSEGEVKYFYSFCLNGCFGLVKTWLLEGEDKSPEYMAEMTYRMVVNSVNVFKDVSYGERQKQR